MSDPVDDLHRIARRVHDQERLILLLHRVVLERESQNDGTTLSAIAEDVLIDYYTSYKVQGRLLSKKEQAYSKAPSPLKPL